MQNNEVDRLKSAISSAKNYLSGINEEDWAMRMKDGIERMESKDFSFVEPLYLKVAPTCEIEELFITEPESHNPPMTEEEANSTNDKFAVIVNELSNALKPFWDRIHQQ